jgi:hypothetical protein
VVNKSVKYFSNFTTTSPVNAYYNIGFFPEIELHASDPMKMICGYSRILLYNASTSSSTELSTHEGWWATKTCPSDANKIYAAGGNSYYDPNGTMVMSDDGGGSWSTVSGNTGWPGSWPRISDIGVCPVNSHLTWVTFSGFNEDVKVYYTGNSGSNWFDKTYDLPNVPIWCVEVDNSNNVYIGTEYGVYFLPVGSTSWEPYYNGLPNVPVSELAINQGTNDQLLASTFGRGIWKTTLWDDCGASETVSGTIGGKFFKTAGSTMTVTATVQGGEGTDVYLRSNGNIRFLPGFECDGTLQNDLFATLGPCEQGLPPDYMENQLVYPAELMDYEITFTREEGTIEVSPPNETNKDVILRMFQDGNARIILADFQGKYIQDIIDFPAKKGTYDYPINTTRLASGLYYLYLVVDGEVVHLHEMEL